MPDDLNSILDRATSSLRKELGPQLLSCSVYGSAVRGNYLPGISDINLLILLQESNATTHQAVARALSGLPGIDPFILGARGFSRSVRAFAPKFESIKRHSRLLWGEDPLKGVTFDRETERFLCEQALRNLRLRLVYTFVTRKSPDTYTRFLRHSVTPLFVQLSNLLRLSNVEIPNEFRDRVPTLSKELGVKADDLLDLLELRQHPDQKISENEIINWHSKVFGLLDQTISWIETRWVD